MPIEVVMPRLGLTMDEGTIVRWLVGEGETVTKGQALLEVDTEKVRVEVESPASGILQRILVGPDNTVPVGQVIGYIVAPDEQG